MIGLFLHTVYVVDTGRDKSRPYGVRYKSYPPYPANPAFVINRIRRKCKMRRGAIYRALVTYRITMPRFDWLIPS